MGKVMGIRVFSTQSLRPISKVGGGFLADRFGVKYFMMLSGILVLINGLVFYSEQIKKKIE